MICQVGLAILIGLFILDLKSKNNIQPNVFIGSLDIGNKDKSVAIKEVDNYFNEIINKNNLTIQYGESNEYKVKYSDINAKIDSNSTINLAYGNEKADVLTNLLYGHFLSKKRVISPIVKFDVAKLTEKLEELSFRTDRDEVDANIYLKGQELIKVPEENGIELNVSNIVEKIKNQIGMFLYNDETYVLSNENELEKVVPEHTMKYYESVNGIIGSYSTIINDENNIDSIKRATKAINGVLILPEDKSQENSGEFSFNKYISTEKPLSSKRDDGYNQVASTLNAAILVAGVNPDFIYRSTHESMVDYIDAGLDVAVLGNRVDFKFQNTLGGILVIFAEVKGNKLTVNIVGKNRDKPNSSAIKVETSKEIISNKQKDVNDAKPGVLASVYRVTDNGKEVKKSLLYIQKYNATQ